MLLPHAAIAAVLAIEVQTGNAWDGQRSPEHAMPTLRCTAELVQAEAAEAAENGAKIQQFLGESHDRAKPVKR